MKRSALASSAAAVLLGSVWLITPAAQAAGTLNEPPAPRGYVNPAPTAPCAGQTVLVEFSARQPGDQPLLGSAFYVRCVPFPTEIGTAIHITAPPRPKARVRARTAPVLFIRWRGVA